VPELIKAREAGKIRFVGITEEFLRDPGHRTLQMALEHDCWDTMMVGFNLVNQCARDRVFPRTRQKNIGTLIMFAVRRALSRRDKLDELMRQLVDEGRVDAGEIDLADPLGFLTDPGVADSIVEAAYRYCRHEPGCDVILSGTGNTEHLEQNARAMTGDPLPGAVLDRLAHTFRRVDHVHCS
jgi:aryl-alcohol dehydrogenase-like predicted oxidoreductase